MPYAIATLAEFQNDIYPSFGTIGYALLLDNLTPTRSISSIASSVFTVPTVTWVTGTRVRISTSGSLPTTSPQVSTGIDYFLRRTSSTQFTLYPTLADAIADTNQITVSGSGSGNTFTEQVLSAEDALEVLVNHELTHADYSRYEVFNVGTASATTGELPPYVLTVTANSPNGSLTFGSVLILRDGLSTEGDTTGTKDYFSRTPTEVVVTEGSTKTVTIVLSAVNPA